jgi:hypothetical protein
MRIFILAAMALIAQPALAQSSDASGAATSNTSNGSTSQNTDATAANTVVVNAVAGNPQYAPADSTVKYSGHTYSTPSMGGSVFGGTNPCMIGTGGAAAGGPIGFSLSIGKSDDGCMRRSEAAAWHALGFDNVAVARLCQDQDAADAFFSATGLACPGTGGSRYRTPEGQIANTAVIASTNKSFVNNPVQAPALDPNDPQVQAMVQAAVADLIKNNPDEAIRIANQAKGQMAPAPAAPAYEANPVVQATAVPETEKVRTKTAGGSAG